MSLKDLGERFRYLWERDDYSVRVFRVGDEVFREGDFMLVCWGGRAVPATLHEVKRDIVCCREIGGPSYWTLPLDGKGSRWTRGSDPESPEAHAMVVADSLRRS